MIKAVIHENNLRQDNNDGVILATATHNFKPLWNWHSSVAMKSGKGWTFPTAEKALLAAAKSLRVTVVLAYTARKCDC